jgi:hypothetical protein
MTNIILCGGSGRSGYAVYPVQARPQAEKSLFPAEAALVADRIWDGDIFETIGSDIGDDNTVSE